MVLAVEPSERRLEDFRLSEQKSSVTWSLFILGKPAGAVVLTIIRCCRDGAWIDVDWTVPFKISTLIIYEPHGESEE